MTQSTNLIPVVIENNLYFSIESIAKAFGRNNSNVLRDVKNSIVFEELSKLLKSSMIANKLMISTNNTDTGENLINLTKKSLLPLNLALHLATGYTGKKSQYLRLNIIDSFLAMQVELQQLRVLEAQEEVAQLECELKSIKIANAYAAATASSNIPLREVADNLGVTYAIVKAKALELDIIKTIQRVTEKTVIGDSGFLVDASIRNSTVVFDETKMMELMTDELY